MRDEALQVDFHATAPELVNVSTIWGGSTPFELS